MKVNKKEVQKSMLELVVELSQDEFKPYIEQGAAKISKEIKIDGFRGGKVPYEVLKQKIGEMAILEESARIAINKTITKALEEVADQQLIGQPKVDIVKLAPGNPFEYKIEVALIPEIILGKYKELGIKESKIEVKDEEVEKTIEEIRESRASEMLADREIREGDKVLVDIKMFQDNVPVDGGQAKGTAVLIGQDFLVPGFDKQLLGAKKGDHKSFSLPYPKNHFMKSIAGKMVDFKVDIQEIYERIMPEVNDDFAKAFGINNLKELKGNIKKGLEAEKKQNQSRLLEKELIEKIIEKTKFGEIPSSLVQHEGDIMIEELKEGVAQQGGKFEDYLQSISKSESQLKLDMMPDAMKRVKASLLIRELAKKEGIKASEEEIDHQIEHLKSHYDKQPDIQKRLDSVEYRNYVLNVQTSRKVVEKLIEWNARKEK